MGIAVEGFKERRRAGHMSAAASKERTKRATNLSISHSIAGASCATLLRGDRRGDTNTVVEPHYHYQLMLLANLK